MDLAHIQVLIDVLKQNGIKNFSLKEADGREIALEFQSAPVHEASVQSPAFSTAIPTQVEKPGEAILTKEVLNQKTVNAEMVGTVYLAVSEQKPKFVEIGSKVQKGQTLCLIEAMKTYFEVKSTQDGTIEKVLVADKEAVDFGKPLFCIV
jgi:biotin carboxyl carrier protein